MFSTASRHGNGPSSVTNSSDQVEHDVEIHRSEEHFRRLLDKLPAGAYMCDREGLITYYNQEAVRLWGRTPELNDSIDRFCGSFKLFMVDGTPIDHDECWMALALKHSREYNGEEIMIERPDGTRVIGLAHANPIKDEAGRMLGAVNVLVDITERKRAEEALKRSDAAKDEFLALLSHELRNPLTPLRNALSVLRHKGTDVPEGTRALKVIDRQLGHLTHLVGDLLDINRINGGKLVLRESDVSLDDLIESALETSRPLIEEAEHELIVRTLPDAIYLRGDAARLTQALSNVLNNAACYTPRGGRIELVVERADEEILITVNDNGIGITPEKLDGIFDMFAQAECSPDRAHDGLGLGLTLTRRVLELHGGSISAESAGNGAGSTFTIRLPAISEFDAPQPQESKDKRLEEITASGFDRRILIVDDNPDVIESMSMLLEIMNIDVRTAGSGREAIELGESYRPNVVLMDIGMPGMNGLECARAMRQREWGKAANMIAVTGWGQEADIQRSLDAGFDDHLVKPMDPDALMALLSSSDLT